MECYFGNEGNDSQNVVFKCGNKPANKNFAYCVKQIKLHDVLNKSQSEEKLLVI